MGRRGRHARGRFHARLPNLDGILHRGRDEETAHRRLRAREKHARRLQDLPVCRPPCVPGAEDFDRCNCARLADCIGNMTNYDVALLFTEGYIGTDPNKDNFAAFTEEGGVNLFDADFGITGKIRTVKDLAITTKNGYSPSTCVELLSELFTACDPHADSCSGMNSRSYQLTVVSEATFVSSNQRNQVLMAVPLLYL